MKIMPFIYAIKLENIICTQGKEDGKKYKYFWQKTIKKVKKKHNCQKERCDFVRSKVWLGWAGF